MNDEWQRENGDDQGQQGNSPFPTVVGVPKFDQDSEDLTAHRSDLVRAADFPIGNAPERRRTSPVQDEPAITRRAFAYLHR
jgi:hypothetical protein